MVRPAMAVAPPLPVSFQLSYEGFESYPYNLIYRTTCMAINKAYKTRLDELDEALLKLFIEKDEAADVPFLDFRGLGKFSHCPAPTIYLLTVFTVFENRHICNDSKLKEWMEGRSSIDPLVTTRTRELVTQPDPKCRFM